MRHPKDSQSQAMPFIFSRIVPVIAIGIFFYLAIVIFSKKPHHEPDLISLTSTKFGNVLPSHKQIISNQQWAPKLAATPITLNLSTLSIKDVEGTTAVMTSMASEVKILTYLGNPSPGWGNCIILAHRDTDGNLVQSMYAHLLNTSVHIGQLVSRGTHIGGVGQADVGYLAHLHLETRAADGVSPFLSGYPEFTQHDRMNPTKFIDDHRAPESSHIAPAALKVLEKNKILPQLSMQIDHPYDEAAFKRYQRYLIEANKSGKE